MSLELFLLPTTIGDLEGLGLGLWLSFFKDDLCSEDGVFDLEGDLDKKSELDLEGDWDVEGDWMDHESD